MESPFRGSRWEDDTASRMIDLKCPCGANFGCNRTSNCPWGCPWRAYCQTAGMGSAHGVRAPIGTLRAACPRCGTEHWYRPTGDAIDH